MIYPFFITVFALSVVARCCASFLTLCQPLKSGNPSKEEATAEKLAEDLWGGFCWTKILQSAKVSILQHGRCTAVSSLLLMDVGKPSEPWFGHVP